MGMGRGTTPSNSILTFVQKRSDDLSVTIPDCFDERRHTVLIWQGKRVSGP